MNKACKAEIPVKKQTIKEIIFSSLLSLMILVAAGLLLFPLVKAALHLDFSREYRQVEGVEGIRFRDRWSGKVYGRAFWGLCPRPVLDDTSQGWQDDAEGETPLCLSPDGRYQLFCEIEYGVNGGYSTDEEYCYYRVIDRENGTQYTIYEGYREWYQFWWEE